MITIKGTYENGNITLDIPIENSQRRNVVVTFLEEEPILDDKDKSIKNRLDLKKMRGLTQQIKSSLLQELIEERRKYV